MKLTERDKAMLLEGWRSQGGTEPDFNNWLKENEQRLAESAPSNWIPVSERLPDSFPFMTYWTDGEMDCFYGYEADGYTDKEHMENIFAKDIGIVCTHWQPLPSPPDSATGED